MPVAIPVRRGPTVGRRSATAALLCLGALVAVAAGAADLTVLKSFGYQPDGEYPEGRLVQGADGTLYGTTYGGGTDGYGMVFAVPPDGSTFTTLHSFTGADGQQLSSGVVIGTDGNLYGTTPQGTVCVNNNCTGIGGTVFRLSTSGSFATLYTFAGNGFPTGWAPGDLVDGGDGYFYGTTANGGAAGVNGVGTVFRIDANGVLTTLHSFTPAEPYYPDAALSVGPGGTLYGATGYAPGSNDGALITITRTGTVATVHTFTGADGSKPSGRLLLASDGNLYGTTSGGGAKGGGTLFRLTPAGVLTTLHAFNPAEGAGPAAGLVQTADGSLYGVTGSGGAGGGTVFRLSSRGVFTTLHQFTFADGTYPADGPVLGSDGKLYGTTSQGGSGGTDHFPTGTVYSFDPAAPHPPVLTLDKVCYNELGECLPPYDSVVGGSVGLVWDSADVSNCRASGSWSGSKPTGGSVKFVTRKRGSFPYTLECRSAAGPVSATVTITVGP